MAPSNVQYESGDRTGATDRSSILLRNVNKSGNLLVKPKSKPPEPMLSEASTDAECVERLQRGETDAFEPLIRRHQKTIFNLVYRMLGDYDEAAEVSQEAFLSAYKAINTFRGDANFSTWLYRIALNHATTRRKTLNLRQQRYVAIENSDAATDPQLGPAETLEKKEVRERVQQAMNSLDPDDATVILLRDLHDTPYEEVARVLEIPIGTVKSRLHRARQALKVELASYFKARRKAV
ncbi:MAG: sigma-70 family RNA polymerase sigma factor [Deltaproteobacteria bacterium]|nr:sigma-70 family RNA polymerase sigma factor [Deltaproteobacteria bacterium]